MGDELRPDFYVFLEKGETNKSLLKKILWDLFQKPLKYNKPRTVFLGGGSGEGKSYGAHKIMELLLGEDVYESNMVGMNIITPLEYDSKITGVLHNENKLINMVALHESRDLIRAKLWYSFVTQTVADVTQQSRTVRPVCFFVVSQFLSDITLDVRKTLNFYGKFYRPLGRPSRLYLKAVWHDDRDIQDIKIRKRRIRGILVDVNGKRRVYSPEYFELGKPKLSTRTLFDKLEKVAKDDILAKKMKRLREEIRLELGVDVGKDVELAAWFVEDTARLEGVAKIVRGKYKLETKYCELHKIDSNEKKAIELAIARLLPTKKEEDEVVA